MIDEIYTTLTNDSTLMSALAGGLYKASVVSMISRQNTPNAFDSSGEILPCGLLKLESSVPTPPHYTGSSRYMLVYLYERFGYSSVSTALKRIFDLVHRTSFAISEGDGLWRIDWAGDVLDSWDDALGCSLITSRYVGYIRRG